MRQELIELAAAHGLPKLYSFRRCPYAIRARMALLVADIAFELIEVELKNKPAELYLLSAKATVPVLALADDRVIDESREIIAWALSHRDPEGWLYCDEDRAAEFIADCDGRFKYWLDRYKYHVGYPDASQSDYRAEALDCLHAWDSILRDQPFLLGDRRSVADLCLFPFVRQFANVDRLWFYQQTSLSALRKWLNVWLEDALFTRAMHKV